MDGAQYDRDRPDLALMLPFYANGTLEPEAGAQMEAALARDAELRAELGRVREARALVRRGGAAFGGGGRSATRRLGALLGRLGSSS